MPKPYSRDLRERVVRFVEEGRSRHAAAAHFEVSVSFVVKLISAFRATGSLDPKPSGGRRHAKLEPHRTFLLARVDEQPDSVIVLRSVGQRCQFSRSCTLCVVVPQPYDQKLRSLALGLEILPFPGKFFYAIHI